MYRSEIMINEKNMKPSDVLRVQTIVKRIMDIGLTYDDVITLIVRKTKNKVSRSTVDKVIVAMRQIERQLSSK